MFDSEKQPGVKLTRKVTGGLNGTVSIADRNNYLADFTNIVKVSKMVNIKTRVTTFLC